jgi:hypothetical protein
MPPGSASLNVATGALKLVPAVAVTPLAADASAASPTVIANEAVWDPQSSVHATDPLYPPSSPYVCVPLSVNCPAANVAAELLPSPHETVGVGVLDIVQFAVATAPENCAPSVAV